MLLTELSSSKAVALPIGFYNRKHFINMLVVVVIVLQLVVIMILYYDYGANNSTVRVIKSDERIDV